MEDGDEREKGKDDILDEAKERFALAVEADAENREKAEDDLQFAAGEQWPEKISRERDNDGRPSLVLNRIPVFLRKIVNDVRQNLPSITVVGVDDKADPDTAEVLTGLIRNIETQSDAETAYFTAVDSSARGGFGVISVDVEYTDDASFEQDIRIRREANPFRWYFDPAAKALDKSDAKWAFETEMLSHEDAEQYGEGVADWEGDDEGDEHWCSEEGVRVARYWRVVETPVTIVQLANGAVMPKDQVPKEVLAAYPVVKTRKSTVRSVECHLVSGGKVLKTYEWKGKYIPAVFVPGEELLVEGKRVYKGIVRDLRDAQRMLNYWRSAATEKVALEPKAPWLVPQGSIDGYEAEWDQANSRNLPYLVYRGPTPPSRQMFSGNAAPMLEQSMAAAQDLKDVSGIYDASLGAMSNETSGVAIRQRQRQGDNSTFHYADNLKRAVAQVGRIIVDLLPSIYDTERVIRVLNEDNTTKVQVINALFPAPGQEKAHDVRVGKYDVIVRSGPSYQTQRQEAVESMTSMVQANPQLMGVIGDLLVKNMDWPGADEMAKRLKAMLPPPIAAIADGTNKAGPQVPPQIQMQMQQAQQQMQAMQQQMQQLQAELTKAQGTINAKTIDLDIARENARATISTNETTQQVKAIDKEIKIAEWNARAAEANAKAAEVVAQQQMGMNTQAVTDAVLSSIQGTVDQVAQVVGSLAPIVARKHGRRQIIRDPATGEPAGVRYEDGFEEYLDRDESGTAVGISPANYQ